MVASACQPAAIGGYEILEQVGRGSQGTVFRCRDKRGNVVAIKVAPAEIAANPKARMRFVQECQISANLNHPHIVRVLDHGLDGTKPYLVMEFIDGEDMGQHVDRAGRLPVAEAIRLIVQVGHALQWAHKKKLVHRDIKPDNILISSAGVAKLTDLGLAKNLDMDFNLTRTMSCIGTPNFMAPEQFDDSKRADSQCDLYSLAATLYMALTGALPFRARSTRALATIYKMKLANDLPAPRQVVADIPEHVNAALVKALRAKREERFGTVQEFLDALTQGLDVGSDPNGKALPTLPLPDTEPIPCSVSRDAAGRERRIMKRYPSRRKAKCLPVERERGEAWPGKLVNISETGLCLELARRFEPGAVLHISLDCEQLQRQSLLLRVMWVKQLKPGAFQLGCQHDQPLNDCEVAALR